jgi:hypothetical protein
MSNPNPYRPSNELVALKSKAEAMEKQERVIHTLEAFACDLRRGVISVETCLRALPAALGTRVAMVGAFDAEPGIRVKFVEDPHAND